MFGYEDYGYMELCCGLYMVIWVCPKLRDVLGFYDQLIQEDDGKGSIIKSGVLITGGLWPSHRNGGFLTPAGPRVCESLLKWGGYHPTI